jgi:hypothetical protein
MAALMDAGIITYTRQAVTVRDPQRLRDAATPER